MASTRLFRHCQNLLMDLNPNESPRSSPDSRNKLMTQPDVGVPSKSYTPTWHRFLRILGPFSAGILALAGIEHAIDREWIAASIDLGLAMGMLVAAWSWQ